MAYPMHFPECLTYEHSHKILHTYCNHSVVTLSAKTQGGSALGLIWAKGYKPALPSVSTLLRLV